MYRKVISTQPRFQPIIRILNNHLWRNYRSNFWAMTDTINLLLAKVMLSCKLMKSHWKIISNKYKMSAIMSSSNKLRYWQLKISKPTWKEKNILKLLQLEERDTDILQVGSYNTWICDGKDLLKLQARSILSINIAQQGQPN